MLLNTWIELPVMATFHVEKWKGESFSVCLYHLWDNDGNHVDHNWGGNKQRLSLEANRLSFMEEICWTWILRQSSISMLLNKAVLMKFNKMSGHSCCWNPMVINRFTQCLIEANLYSLPQKKVYTFVEPSTQNWGGQMKSRGVPHSPFSRSKLGQASFWNSDKWLHLLEFQNETWSSLDRLNGGCEALLTFPLAPLNFDYLAMPQVYTFFWWRLYGNKPSIINWFQD